MCERVGEDMCVCERVCVRDTCTYVVCELYRCVRIVSVSDLFLVCLLCESSL